MKDFLRKFIAKYSCYSPIVGFAVFLFLFLLSDRLVWMSDVGKININGWISIIHRGIPLFLLSLAPLFLLGRYAKYLYFPLFFAEIVLQGAGWFARVNFKMVLDGDLIGIVLGSSPAEMM